MIKILHAEDDPDIREIADMALAMSGQFEVLQCTDGQNAVDAATEFAPDLLLLDVMMPNMTGPEVLATLRLNPAFAEVPAIFMTARVQSAEKQNLIDQGAIAVIAKPFDPITLADDIMAALGR